MIRTVCLNPAVDRTLTIPNFAVNAVNRIGSIRVDAGGKGINVSKAILALGGKSEAYGFLAGKAGSFIRERLAEWGIPDAFVEIGGETRTNLKIVDPELLTHTDINEAGPAVTPEDLAALERRVFGDACAGDILVFSGSVPRGVSHGIYADWIKRAKSIGAVAVLDADGELLRSGIRERPYLVKPNRAEFEGFLGKKLPDIPSTCAAARDAVDSGIPLIAISLGADGAVFADAERTAYAPALPIVPRSTVGAGDSMLAALVMGIEGTVPFEELVSRAVAAGTAAAATEGTKPPSAEDIAAFGPLVKMDMFWMKG